MRVATNARSEALAVSLPECIDASVASILMDGGGRIAFAFAGAGSSGQSPAPLATLSDSFVWHGTLVSNCSEMGSQFRILIEILDTVDLGRPQ